MKNDNTSLIKTLLIASVVLLIISTAALIINLVTLEGNIKSKEIMNIVVTSISLSLVIVFVIILMIRKKKHD